MGNMDIRWLLLFAGQLLIGGALLWYPPANAEGAAQFGFALVSSAFGQGITATLKATKE